MSNYPTNAPEMLSAMARMYNYDLSDFESMLWMGEVFDVYPDKDIILALKHYMENGDQSRFMPKYGDIKKLLETQDDTIQQLNLLVTRYGSYSTPPPEEISPLLLATIEQLGGWVKVCAEMPDSANGMQFSQYLKRAESACNIARKRVAIYSEEPKSLTSRSDSLPPPKEENQPNAHLLTYRIDLAEVIDKMNPASKIKHLKSGLSCK